MTGYDIYNRAAVLLSFTGPDGNVCPNEGLLRRAKDILAQLCCDLEVPVPALLTDEVDAEPEATAALCYGMAMLLSLTEGEPQKNAMFTELYNAKRAAVKAGVTKTDDVLPGGVD